MVAIGGIKGIWFSQFIIKAWIKNGWEILIIWEVCQETDIFDIGSILKVAGKNRPPLFLIILEFYTKNMINNHQCHTHKQDSNAMKETKKRRCTIPEIYDTIWAQPYWSNNTNGTKRKHHQIFMCQIVLADPGIFLYLLSAIDEGCCKCDCYCG